MEHPVKKKRRRAHKFNDIQELPDLDPHNKVKPSNMKTFQNPMISEANLMILEANLLSVKNSRRAQRMCLLDLNPYNKVKPSDLETFQDPVISEANLFSIKKRKRANRRKKFSANAFQKQGCSNHWTTPCVLDLEPRVLDLDPYSSVANEEGKSSEISLVRAPVGPFHWTTPWVLDLDPYSSVVRAPSPFHWTKLWVLDFDPYSSVVRTPVGLLKRKLLILNLNGLLAHIFDIVDLDPKYKPDFTFGNKWRT
jgi:hypothetical protein